MWRLIFWPCHVSDKCGIVRSLAQLYFVSVVLYALLAKKIGNSIWQGLSFNSNHSRSFPPAISVIHVHSDNVRPTIKHNSVLEPFVWTFDLERKIHLKRIMHALEGEIREPRFLFLCTTPWFSGSLLCLEYLLRRPDKQAFQHHHGHPHYHCHNHHFDHHLE